MALHRLPENCVCGQKKNNVEYALLCTKEGLMTIRHYKLRDTTANLLKIISNELKSEPSLFHFHS